MMRTTAILYALVMWSAATGTAWAADHFTVAVVGQADAQPLQQLIEAELTAALSEHAGLVIVDRSRIDDLLAEQEWSTAQLVRQPLKGGRMIGAQFIVYLGHESSPGGHRVSLIAVETESGNVVGERAWRLAAGPDPDTRPLVQDATRLIRAGVARSQAEAEQPHRPGANGIRITSSGLTALPSTCAQSLGMACPPTATGRTKRRVARSIPAMQRAFSFGELAKHSMSEVTIVVSQRCDMGHRRAEQAQPRIAVFS